MYLTKYSVIHQYKGYSRAILIDSQRGAFEIMPNSLIDIINELKNVPFDEFINRYKKQKDIIESYINFLIEKDFVFQCKSRDSFPDINLYWDFPAIITNTYIDFSGNLSIYKTIAMLAEIQVNLVTIKIINLTDLNLIDLNHTCFERIKSIILIIKTDEAIEKEQLISLSKLPKLNQIFLNLKSYNLDDLFYSHKFLDVKIIEHKVNLNSFSTNLELVSESQKHHTYFNRKLYIGTKGEIKNAPECKEEFGKIQDLKNAEELKKIIATKEFQKYWYVHKEIMDVCKDCEFRHMCVDNRLPYKREEEEWYHKTECNYNPYICKWGGEKGYKTLAGCGVVSNEKEFSINHEKIAEINAELWGK